MPFCFEEPQSSAASNEMSHLASKYRKFPNSVGQFPSTFPVD